MLETSQSTAKTRAAALSIVSNCALIAIKVIAGLATGSIAILSDGVHSLMDLIASDRFERQQRGSRASHG